MKIRKTEEKTIVKGTQKELAQYMKSRFNISESDFNKHCATSRKNDYIWNDFIQFGLPGVIVYLVKNEMFIGISA